LLTQGQPFSNQFWKQKRISIISLNYSLIPFSPNHTLVDSLLCTILAVPRNILKRAYWTAIRPVILFGFDFSKIIIFKYQKQHYFTCEFVYMTTFYYSLNKLSTILRDNLKKIFILINKILLILTRTDKKNLNTTTILRVVFFSIF
jgi:hypothetical protein